MNKGASQFIIQNNVHYNVNRTSECKNVRREWKHPTVASSRDKSINVNRLVGTGRTDFKSFANHQDVVGNPVDLN